MSKMGKEVMALTYEDMGEPEAYTQPVTCNNCGFNGEENALELVPDGNMFFKACPHCHTDAYLSDVC